MSADRLLSIPKLSGDPHSSASSPFLLNLRKIGEPLDFPRFPFFEFLCVPQVGTFPESFSIFFRFPYLFELLPSWKAKTFR